MNRLFRQKTSPSSSSALTSVSQYYIITPTVLGSGSFATVKLGQDKSTGRNVAIKIIEKTKLKASELKKLYAEVNILKDLNHKNVVRFFASFDEGEKFYIVMEYVTGGNLFDKIVDENIAYNESDVRSIMRSTLKALRYCKGNGVIHRDIKPENILLSAEGDIKLADFNLSYQLDPSQAEFSLLQTMLGTPNYVAPEVLSGKPYSYKCDIWSTGVICYLLLSGGYLPFNVDPKHKGEEGRALLLDQVKRGKWSFAPAEAWEAVSDDAKDFMQNIMYKDPERRFDYDQLLSHPWLDDGNAPDVDEGELQQQVIKAAELARYNARRKMYAVKNVKQAVAAFESLMRSEQFSEVQATQTSFLGSGIDAFKDIIDFHE